MRILTQWLLVISITVLLAACGNSSNTKQVKIAYVNWEESIAFSYVAQELLEAQGYDVKLMNADIAPVYASLARKKADVFMNAWLPYGHRHYNAKYGSKLELLNTNYTNGVVGLVVPKYVEIDSISQMADIAESLNYEIVGIDAGAGIMKGAQMAIDQYGLKGFKLLTSSESAMVATLKKAVLEKKPIVITGWKPHWMFERHNLKFLADPKLCMGEKENIQTFAWKGFAEAHPKLTAFFKGITFTDASIANLLDTFKKYDNPKEAAKAWIKENQEIVNQWTTKES